ncbi:MAG: FG-GAP-like repeat-containing protein [Pirellulales bacterium]|nr:FG-GAP-like repeat-containing protein [Pirellulales bacterium]
MKIASMKTINVNRRTFLALCVILLCLQQETPLLAQNTEPMPAAHFRQQYHIADDSFCNSMVCVDFNNDGQRELLFASRKTHELQMLRATDGAVIWSRKLAGDSQTLSAYDLDGDGMFEILYSVSEPGRLYVIDHTGKVIRQWDSGDSKLGNSAVIVDVDRDGHLDGLFGSRSKYLLRLNMSDLTQTKRRTDWVQCGCYTTAMDVDNDGRWDFFAGSGDDFSGKGVLHRYDPVTLETIWSHKTNDNASSADPVLADIDGDGQVEILKSVDNYANDDAHDAVFAFETDGTLLWKVSGLAGEDSPDIADLDGDGEVEIVGMTFGGEVYCLDSKGRLKWRKDLRPELDDKAHAYLTPILCDLNGDQRLEIIAMTNGGYFVEGNKANLGANGVIFALTAEGKVLSQFDVGGKRYWGDAFVCNVDDDPFLELVISGSGGLDVIETRGVGANTEHFQRRKDYRRSNVLPWAYEDTYFIYRGSKEGVTNGTDNLVLAKKEGVYERSGTFTTDLLTLPPDTRFDRVSFNARTSNGTTIMLAILDASGKVLENNHDDLGIIQPIRLQFRFSTTDNSVSPILDSYRLSFRPNSEQ